MSDLTPSELEATIQELFPDRKTLYYVVSKDTYSVMRRYGVLSKEVIIPWNTDLDDFDTYYNKPSYIIHIRIPEKGQIDIIPRIEIPKNLREFLSLLEFQEGDAERLNAITTLPTSFISTKDLP